MYRWAWRSEKREAGFVVALTETSFYNFYSVKLGGKKSGLLAVEKINQK